MRCIPCWRPDTLLGGCCYVLPIVILFRNDLRDARLRAWLRVLPAWFGFIFVYGVLMETRISQ